MIDCLIVGFNDYPFDSYVDMVGAMGKNSGSYRDLNLAFITHEGKRYRALDLLSKLHEGDDFMFHNTDFLWPTITYLGSYLAQRGFTFDYVNLPQAEQDAFREKLQNGNIRTIAITTTLYVSPHPILDVVSFIRKYNSDVKILIGGPYVANLETLAPKALQDIYKYLGGDVYVVSREGELALSHVLTALRDGDDLSGIENLAYRDGDRYVITEKSPESNSLEENMVDYSLFPQESLGNFVSLRTAKSCPFACSFCAFPTRAGKYTYLGLDHVEQELDRLAERGNVSTITFLDDTFNVPKKRFKEILRLMIRKQYGFKWNSYYRSDHGDEETIELMGEAGCEGVFLGAESGSDTILQNMNKTARRADYMKAIPLLRKAGVTTHVNIIVGFPGETDETVRETISLIEEVEPDFFRSQLWYADPTTPIWKEKDAYEIKGSAFNWTHRTMNWETACEWVDRMFLETRNSLWLPQWGFELWSVFYLQRHGMTIPQIKNFVSAFNDAIKLKVSQRTETEIRPEDLERLRQHAQFTRVSPDTAFNDSRQAIGS